MTDHFLVSQCYSSKYWYVSTRRPNVSATVWETIQPLGFHRTAKAARAALEAEVGPLDWAKSIGRGSASYRTSVEIDLQHD